MSRQLDMVRKQYKTKGSERDYLSVHGLCNLVVNGHYIDRNDMIKGAQNGFP